MADYLTFKKFISSEVLIFFYYFFALIMPLFFWVIKNKIFEIEFIRNIFPQIKKLTYDNLTFRQKLLFVFIFIFCFLMCEIFLRMFFEFLIAYIQIRDVLVGG